VENRERLLVRAFARLADTLADDFDVVEFLQGLTADAVEVLDAEAAGVMLSDGWGTLRVVASSEERMRLLELFELQTEQGPCLEAFRTGVTVQAVAAEGRDRWPTFAATVAQQGFQYMCAVPLRLREDVLGALNLFRDTDEPFSETDLEIAQAMAQVAATGLLQARTLTERQLLTEQLQYALHSRVAIEQAKGMLAEYLDVSVDDAFLVLRDQARSNNRKLTELARDVATRTVGPDVFTADRAAPLTANLAEPGDHQRRRTEAGPDARPRAEPAGQGVAPSRPADRARQHRL
jgi:GAF domain-containing protein